MFVRHSLDTPDRSFDVGGVTAHVVTYTWDRYDHKCRVSHLPRRGEAFPVVDRTDVSGSQVHQGLDVTYADPGLERDHKCSGGCIDRSRLEFAGLEKLQVTCVDSIPLVLRP
jgi:hypothetical protein